MTQGGRETLLHRSADAKVEKIKIGVALIYIKKVKGFVQSFTRLGGFVAICYFCNRFSS